MTDVESVFHRLTLLHTRSHGDEGHEAAESQVDPQQGLVEVAGDGVCVVLVHEGEGHGGDGVEEECGAHDGQIPTLVLCGSSQPERKHETEEEFQLHVRPDEHELLKKLQITEKNSCTLRIMLFLLRRLFIWYLFITKTSWKMLKNIVFKVGHKSQDK